MVPEEKKADYMLDTLEIIKRCLRGKRDYFGVILYAEAHQPSPCGCKEPTEEDPCIPIYEYAIYIDLPKNTEEKRIKKLLPISIEKDSAPGLDRALLVRILSTNNNMEIVENGEEASTVIHLALENYISMYLNRVIRDFTEGEI